MAFSASTLIAAAVVLALVSVPGTAGADTIVRQLKRSPAHTVMGRQVPASETVITTWIGEGRLRTEDGEGKAVILRDDLNRVWYLDLREKTYREMPLGTGGLEGDSAATGTVKAAVTDTGEEKRIGRWNCRKYTVTLSLPLGNAAPPSETVSEIWTTLEIEADRRLYGVLANLAVSRRPGSAGALEELGKVKGFPVLRVDRFTLMGNTRESTLELTDVSRGEAPPGSYEIPEGFSRAGF